MMKRGPLYDLQARTGVTFIEMDGWALPANYRSPTDELVAAGDGVGLVDLSGWGLLSVKGGSRLDFVQRLSTNNVVGLTEGHGAPTVFATPVGRIVDLALVHVRKDDLLLIVGRGASEEVAGWLRRHIFFGDDVAVEDVTEVSGLMGLVGPGSKALAAGVFGPEAAELVPYQAYVGLSGGADVTLVRSIPWGCEYLALTTADQAPEMWTVLSDAVVSAGGAQVGELALETTRIGAGWPRFGRELSKDYIPLEAGLKWAISFNKGCYVGQEIIARMETYQKLAKRLVVIGYEGTGGSTGAKLTPGQEIRLEAAVVGRVTSVAPLPVEGTIKGLAYVKPSAAEVGYKLQVADQDDALEVRILAVPGE